MRHTNKKWSKFKSKERTGFGFPNYSFPPQANDLEMKLKILEQHVTTPELSNHFRGISRPEPFYIKRLGENHALNQAVNWYIENSDERGFHEDYAKCLNLVEQYARLDSPHCFELIEITLNNSSPMRATEFLGYDLVHLYKNSLLECGLSFDHLTYAKDPSLSTIISLFHLIEALFKPQLNRHGLFDNYEVARFCLHMILTVQKNHPRTSRESDEQYHVLGLYK